MKTEDKINLEKKESAVDKIKVEVTAVLGRKEMPIKELENCGEGTIIELDKLAGEPVDLLANGVKVAKGEVVVIDENFAVRLTEIL